MSELSKNALFPSVSYRQVYRKKPKMLPLMIKPILNPCFWTASAPTFTLKQKLAKSAKDFMNYQRKQEKTIKWDYIAILLTLDLVYNLFKYDTDDNNAFLESSDNVLSESTKKTSSV